MLKKLILVVEDDPAIQFGLQVALQSRGYEVVTACDGQEALDVLDHCDPDLILADIRMPVMNGLQMLLQIKSTESHQHIPVVMISASPGDQATALDSGAAFFLRKPFDHSTLFEIVDSCLVRLNSFSQSLNPLQSETIMIHPETSLPLSPSASGESSKQLHAGGEHDNLEAVSEQRLGQEDDSVQPLEILMIDDDQDFAKMIEVSLVGVGHHVTVIHNWLSLLRQIKNQTPDLILIDIETPTGNGVTAMEFLTMDPAVAAIPKAFVTGVSDLETRRRCEALNATYLHKSGDIVNKIKEFIEDGIERPCSV